MLMLLVVFCEVFVPLLDRFLECSKYATIVEACGLVLADLEIKGVNDFGWPVVDIISYTRHLYYPCNSP